MKHKILSLLIITAAMSTVACSSDDKSAQAGPPSCLTNPTLPGCSLQKAALAQVPGSPEAVQLAMAKPYTPPTGTNQVPTGPNGQPIVIPGLTPPVTGGIAVTSKTIQEHAARVAAALEADNNNPMSSHYIAPKEDESGRAPASVSPGSSIASAPVPIAPTAIDGGGEAIK